MKNHPCKGVEGECFPPISSSYFSSHLNPFKMKKELVCSLKAGDCFSFDANGFVYTLVSLKRLKSGKYEASYKSNVRKYVAEWNKTKFVFIPISKFKNLV